MDRIPRFYHIILILMVLALLVGTAPVAAGQGQEEKPAVTDASLHQALADLPDGQTLSVIVTLRSQADLKEATEGELNRAERQYRVISALKNAAKGQSRLHGLLTSPGYAKRVAKLTPFWIFNGFALTATADIIQLVADQPEVASLRLEQTYHVPVTSPAVATDTMWNLNQIRAPDLWALGFRGQGVVVANVDTGVDVTHPDLASRYRGGTNSWFDATGVSPSQPQDSNGHGTQTMSVMVGGDAGGTSIGVAPEAKWIAARIFAPGVATTDVVIQDALEWILDPDGDPRTADAPDVINNSWTADQYSPGCDLTFQPDIAALRAAGILPVFSSGNYGPNADSSRYPANYPEAFAVGAVDSSDTIAYFSGRGPSSCDGSIYPEVVAPGVNIRVARSGGGYAYNNGTSFSSPHVAGALALLLSAKPDLMPDQQANALMSSAVDLGTPGPDNIYGYGRLDVLAAYNSFYQVRITSSAFSIPENGGAASLTLALNRESPEPVTVFFAANGGTATNGTDYILPSPVTFTPGETQKTAQVTILDDRLPEMDETFTVRLVNPVNAILRDPLSGVPGTIQDNDPQVGFAMPQQSVSESAGTALIAISRTGGLSLLTPISVDCAITGGTALAEIDYQLQSACHVEFSTGETQKTIPITMLPDGQPTLDKTLVFGLSNPQNAVLNPLATESVLIIQNADPWLYMFPLVQK